MLYLYFLLVLQISSEISGSPPVTKPDGSLDLTSLLSRMAVLEQTVSSSQTRSTQLEIELHSTMTKLQATRDDLETTKTELQTTRSDLKATQAELQTTKTELQTTRSDLKAELQTTKTELQTTRSNLQATTTKLQTVKTELQNTKSELALKTKDVAFHVYSNSGDIGSYIPLKFDGVHYNAGNGYNTTTGMFTAPVSGTYIPMTQLEIDGQPPPFGIYIYIIKSSTAISAGYGTLTSVNHDRTITITAVTDLKQGEQVWVTSKSDVYVNGNNSGFTIFVGTLLSAH